MREGGVEQTLDGVRIARYFEELDDAEINTSAYRMAPLPPPRFLSSHVQMTFLSLPANQWHVMPFDAAAFPPSEIKVVKAARASLQLTTVCTCLAILPSFPQLIIGPESAACAGAAITPTATMNTEAKPTRIRRGFIRARYHPVVPESIKTMQSSHVVTGLRDSLHRDIAP